MKALFLLLLLLPQAGTDPVVDAIIQEAKTHSQVMPYLDHLVNKIGPRLTGSTRLTQACEWARAEFEKMGLKSELVEWGQFEVGYDRGAWSAKMTEPEELDLTIGFNAWTPGTPGPVNAPAVLAPTSDEELLAMKEKLHGAWVISSVQGGEKYSVAYDEAGIAGVIRTEGNELIHTGGSFGVQWEKLPKRVQLRMIASQHRKIVELLKAGKDVRLTIDVKAEFKQGPVKLYNVIAELPGTEKPEERVIVGGHLDSWDGAQGATDNGTGVATTLEAARLLTTCKAKPKRTIRFMLWSGEEQGLLGSRGYVKKHPEENPAISAVIVHDGGTNYASGINATEAMLPLFEKAFAPLLKLDPEMPFVIRKVAGLPRGIGSDHDSYLAAGVPGFFWLQAGRAKYGFSHHTQHDTFERAIPEYQRHTSMVIAIGALGLADADELVPRQNLIAAGQKRRQLGIQLDDELGITSVLSGSAAEKAGLQAGDRIVKFNGSTVGDFIMLGQLVQSAPKETKIVVQRQGKDVELAVAFSD